jgi:hypothetical protein
MCPFSVEKKHGKKEDGRKYHDRIFDYFYFSRVICRFFSAPQQQANTPQQQAKRADTYAQAPLFVGMHAAA